MTHLRGVKPALSPDSEALTEVPPPPKDLSRFAKAEWRTVLPQLVARRIITVGDLGGVENLCRARGLVRELETQLRNPAGEIDQKICRLQDKAMQTARQLAAEYGMSPTSRARIGAISADDDDGDNPLNIGKNRR